MLRCRHCLEIMIFDRVIYQKTVVLYVKHEDHQYSCGPVAYYYDFQQDGWDLEVESDPFCDLFVSAI